MGALSWDTGRAWRHSPAGDNFSTDYWTSDSPTKYTWATGNVWRDHGLAIKCTNTCSEPIALTSVKIGAISCNSGGSDYYGFGGLVSTPCTGAQVTYKVFVNICNPGNRWSFSQVTTRPSDKADKCNMTYKGTNGTTDTAQFEPAVMRDYDIAAAFPAKGPPYIMPGGVAYVTFDVTDISSPSSTTIKVNLDEVPNGGGGPGGGPGIVQAPRANVWRWMNADDFDGKGKHWHWHLINPVYKRVGGKWINIGNNEG